MISAARFVFVKSNYWNDIIKTEEEGVIFTQVH